MYWVSLCFFSALGFEEGSSVAPSVDTGGRYHLHKCIHIRRSLGFLIMITCSSFLLRELITYLFRGFCLPPPPPPPPPPQAPPFQVRIDVSGVWAQGMWYDDVWWTLKTRKP